jgi:hypothetical protein
MKKLFFLPLLLFLYACPLTDKCDDPVPEYRLDSDFRSYFDFKPGTYWIYKDSLTGDQDSVFIISRNSEFNEGETGNYCDDRYNFETVNVSIFNGDTIENFVASTTLAGSGYQFYNSTIKGSWFYKIKSGVTPGKDNIIINSTKDSLSLNNLEYSNIKIVYKTLRENGSLSDTIITWWAENVGVIRQTKGSKQTKRLKRYNIIQ